ncbi:MAG: hypothetical protein WD069_11285 [Planctomycetales bacterium]
MKRRLMTALSLSVVLVAGTAVGADGSAPSSPEQFAKLHATIKRQSGEARYLEIDWYPSIWEARQKAAREGKPLFIWAGSEGAPSAGC